MRFWINIFTLLTTLDKKYILKNVKKKKYKRKIPKKMCKSTVNDHSPLNSQIWPPSPVAIRLASGGSYNSKNVK